MQKRLRRGIWLALAVTHLAGCNLGINSIIVYDEDVKAAWADCQSQYKRRADLVPALVATVKASADFEKDTLTQVAEARSKISQMRIDSSIIDDPNSMAQFEARQGQLSAALSRLMVVSEKYPQLRATDGFRDLQAQLEGTENRISVARTRYIQRVQSYNSQVQMFPTMIGAMLRGRKVRTNFVGPADIERPPEVKF